jgi:hypothetical protein
MIAAEPHTDHPHVNAVTCGGTRTGQDATDIGGQIEQLI